jgi:hypothetical protein
LSGQRDWHFSFNGSHIILDGADIWHMDNGVETLTEFASRYALRVEELVVGADRWQLSFQWQAHKFLLCFEALCEAMWIECFYADNINQLADLYSYLLNMQDNN